MRQSVVPVAVTLSVAYLFQAGVVANIPDYTADLADQISELQHQTDQLDQKVQRLGKKQDDAIRSSRSINAFRFGTAPVYGVGTSFDGSDLMINQSSIKKDTQLLQHEQDIENKHGNRDLNLGPRVEVSGLVEAGFKANNQRSNAFQLSDSELNIVAQVNPWISGFTSMVYDETLVDRFTVSQGFLTVGNLNQNPFYGTLGRIYVPFGAYSTNLVTETLTRNLGRSKEDALKLGYFDGHVSGAVFAYNGTIHKNSHQAIDQMGGKLGYTQQQTVPNRGFGFDGSVSYINNLSDADYLSNTVGKSSSGRTLGQMSRYVPAVDVYARINAGKTYVAAEHLKALRHFSQDDFTYNGNAAQPTATHIEGGVNFSAWGTDFTWAVGYGKTQHALIYGVPDHRYSTALSIALLKNTVVGIEYAKNYGYRATDVSALRLSDGTFMDQTQLPSSLTPSPGSQNQVVTVKAGIYF